MKLAKIVSKEFQETVQKLAGQPIPLKAAFKLKGICKALDAEIDKYEAVRQDALNRYGRKNGDGALEVSNSGQVQFDPEAMRSYASEMRELTSTDVEVPKISMTELGDKVNLSLEQLYLLEDIISE